MRVSLAVKERQHPAPLVREMTVISGVVVITTVSFLFCLVIILLAVRMVRKRRRHCRSLSSCQEIPLVYRTPAVSQHYTKGDVFSQIADHSKPLTHTHSTQFLDTDTTHHKHHSETCRRYGH